MKDKFMQELIDRLESLTGPNFELERHIAVASGKALRLSGDGAVEWAPGNTFGVAPAYTCSIDAALLLVPENHTWWVDSEEVIGDGSVLPPSAAVMAYGADFRICDNSKGATPAIAICIAALKARMALKSDVHA